MNWRQQGKFRPENQVSSSLNLTERRLSNV